MTHGSTGNGPTGSQPSRRHLLAAGGGAAAALALGGLTGTASAQPGPAAAAGPLNLDTTLDAVGINYSVWHNIAVGGGKTIYDNTEILREAASSGAPPAWGPLNAFHFWGRPSTGYYRSDDTAVLRRHAQQLVDARVDFVVLDATNITGAPNAESENIYYGPTRVLLDTWKDIRAGGGRTPYVVPWVATPEAKPDPAACGRITKERFYDPGTWDDLFVTYQGKPLMVTTDTLPGELAGDFTLRKMWGLQSQLAEQEWSFLQDYPQNVGTSGGSAEQVCVCAALQKTYMTEPTAVGREGGRTFQEQWRRAFDVRARITILTWWNEWIAMRFEDEAGNTRFVDNYNQPFSRDLEPMDPDQPGGHSDLYYRWMQTYIAAYKDHAPFPEGLLQGSTVRG